MANLSELLGELAAASSGDQRNPNTPDDALARTLQEISARVDQGCQFEVGQLVTPRKGYNLRQTGRPHAVIEIFDYPIRFEAEEPSTMHHLSLYDMRVVTESKGEIVAFAAQSWQYEPYTGPILKADA